MSSTTLACPAADAVVRVCIERHQIEDGGPSEYMIWLRVPKAGNDGALLAVVESELAATVIAQRFAAAFSA